MLQLLAQTADYTYNTTSSSGAGISPVIAIIYLAVVVLMIASMWKVFQKAGKPGWAAIVPFYNTWVLLEIVGKPTWWFFLFFVPFVNIVIAVLVYVELAKAFGKGGGFAVLMILLPFIAFPMLAFGKDQYHAPTGVGGSNTPSQPTPPTAPSEPSAPVAPSSPAAPSAPTPPAASAAAATPPAAPAPVEEAPAAEEAPTDQPPKV